MAGSGRSFKLRLLRRCRPSSRRGAACGCEVVLLPLRPPSPASPAQRPGPRCCRQWCADKARAASGPAPPSCPWGNTTFASIHSDSGSLGGGRSAASARRRTSRSPVTGKLRQHSADLGLDLSNIRRREMRQRDPTRDGIARQPERTAVRTAPHSRSTASASTREPRRRAFLSAMASACSFARRPRSAAAEAATATPPPRCLRSSQ